MTALVLYLCLAVFVSFICSLLEATILSITPIQIGVLKRYGAKSADLLEKLKKDINRSLSSILTINTAANMIGAAGVGAKVTQLYGEVYLGLASGILTLIILIFSEIIPKTLGARYHTQIAPYGAYIIQFLIWVSYPFVVLAEKITSLIPKEQEEYAKVKEELIVSAEMSHHQGMLQDKENTILKNLLTLDTMRVADIMTQRSDVLGYQKDQIVKDILQNDTIRFSRLPVYGEDLDDLVGVVHRYKLIEAQWNKQEDKKVEELCSEIYFVSQGLSVGRALDLFFKTKQHIFIVIDSYGATAGIISLEDAIESLLGEEIIDEYDLVDEDKRIEMIAKDKQKFIIKKKKPPEEA